jgi:glycosyltransferase involved in cell wall biosynthesis
MLAPEFLPVWGGTGSYIVELVKFLPRNVNIHVVTLNRDIPGMSRRESSSTDISAIINRPINVHYLSTSKETFFYNLPFQIACLRKIPQLQKNYKFDIVHSHLVHMPDVLFQLFNRIQLPTVVTVHGTIQMLRDHALMARSLFNDLESGEKYTLLFYPIIKLLQQNYAKHVSRFIAVSKVTKELSMKHLEIEAERISLIYNGVDTGIFHPPEKEEIIKKYSKPTVVYIGRMISKKGIHILIKTMPEIIKHLPQTQFLFVGGGNVPLYRGLIERMGIPKKNVSFTGHVGYFERPKILREATVFVNPSFFENCSISILEAMSCGTSVVANNVGGNPEIIESGKNGILVSPNRHEILAQRIISLLEDENLNKEIGREARKTIVKSFSSERCAQETCNVYKKTLDARC